MNIRGKIKVILNVEFLNFELVHSLFVLLREGTFRAKG